MRKVNTTLLALTAIALTATIASAQHNGTHDGPATGGNNPSNQTVLFRSFGECHDAFTSGITIRTAGGGNINVPPQVVQNAVWAQIFWLTLDDVAPNNGAITVNGNGVVPVANGPVTISPCWPQANAYAYRADVLGLINAGANLLRGFPDSGVENVAPSTEGVTLVIVYTTNTADKEILVLGGNDSIIQSRVDLSIPAISAPGFGAELTLIVGDGQPANDVALWNNVVISAPDAFLGIDPGPGTGYWDTQEYGVATGGANVASIDAFPDCLNWVATVFGVKRGGCVVPVEPSSWSKIKNRLN